MSQNTTQGKNSKFEPININYFYALFEKEKKKYPAQHFTKEKLTVKKGRRKTLVSLALYKKIIITYLGVYFKDFYSSPNNLLYFPLGGYLKKVTYANWTFTMKRGYLEKQVHRSEKAIGLFWFLRPSNKMFHMVTLKKLTGFYSRLTKLERLFSENHDKNLLPIFTTEVKKGTKNKTLYICTLT
jgi:hypothetical protein